MIGAIERNEALGVLCGLEYLAGVVDADYRVQRCVKDQERLPQRADPLGRAPLFQTLQKLLSHRERAPGERHLGLAFGFDFLPRLLEQVTDVGGIERRADGRNGLRSGTCCAAASTAAPPSEWPISSCGA